MEIRALTEADVEAYRSIRLRSLRDDPEAFGSSYEESAARPLSYYVQRLGGPSDADGYTLGAFLDGELVGIVSWRRGDVRKERHKGYVTGMYVAPECRGRGVGRGLLRELIRRAEALPGLELINLSVVTENHAARRLYASLGFRPYGTERRALKLGERYLDEEYMTLSLTER